MSDVVYITWWGKRKEKNENDIETMDGLLVKSREQ